jgi:hypothetical protein
MTALIGAAAFVMMTVAVFAQAPPSFAGKWVREAPAGAAAAAPAGGGGGRAGGRGGGGGLGQEVTITQDASTLTMEYMQGQNPVKRVFKLDGSESMNAMTMGGNEVQQVSKAVWEANKLVITTAGGRGGETKQVLSREGADLVVEQTNPGRGGGDPTTMRIVYKKAM